MDAIINIQAVWADINKYIMPAALRKTYTEQFQNSSRFGKPTVECHAEVRDDIIEKWCYWEDGLRPQELQPDDIMELINTYEEQLSADDLVKEMVSTSRG
jgi:hypothetical protein